MGSSRKTAGPTREPVGRRRFGGTEGFTLIETLVAFVVLALFAVVLQPAIVGTVRSGAAAEARMEAGLVARTLLASPTLFQAGTTASGRMNGHDWTVRFAPLEIAAGSPGKVASVVFRPMRMIVDVAVDARRRGRLQVETVRLVRTPEAANG